MDLIQPKDLGRFDFTQPHAKPPVSTPHPYPPRDATEPSRTISEDLDERTRRLEPVSHRNRHHPLSHHEQALLGWNGPPQNKADSGNQGPHVKAATGCICHPGSSSNCWCSPSPPSSHWEPSQSRRYTLSPLAGVTAHVPWTLPL